MIVCVCVCVCVCGKCLVRFSALLLVLFLVWIERGTFEHQLFQIGKYLLGKNPNESILERLAHTLDTYISNLRSWAQFRLHTSFGDFEKFYKRIWRPVPRMFIHLGTEYGRVCLIHVLLHKCYLEATKDKLLETLYMMSLCIVNSTAGFCFHEKKIVFFFN